MSDQNQIEAPLTKKDIETILQSRLGKDLIVQSYSCIHATKPGENFGSTLLALTITLCLDDTSPAETLHVVAKMAPPTEFLQDAFDMKNTFCKEMNLYKLVGPEFMKLQKEYGVKNEDILDVLAEYYGARTSLNGDQDEHADTNAILLLENLKTSGYKLAERVKGLDLAHCELVVSKLAQFHALPIALKQKKPQIYEQTVLKATAPFKMGGANLDSEEVWVEDILKRIKDEIPEAIPYIERIRTNALKYSPEKVNSNYGKGPFTTIVHNDFWTNNMMFCYGSASDSYLPVEMKFVDFQVTLLSSPVIDLIFFIFSSGTASVQKEAYDHLIELYHKNFISTLKRLECDISAFSFENFQKEIEKVAPTQFFHVFGMLAVIYGAEKDSKNLSEIDNFDAMIKFSDQVKIKMLETLEEFDKRGWF